MKVIYVAGPFRSPSTYVPGHQDHWGIQTHIMEAMRFALEIWRLGAAALCPHANTFCFQNAAPDSVWLDGDLELLRRCDAVFMVPGWPSSQGATAEFREAQALNIPIFQSLWHLEHWLNTGGVS